MSTEPLPFPVLPYDKNFEIFSLFNKEMLLAARRVSRAWRDLSNKVILESKPQNFNWLKLRCLCLLDDYQKNPDPLKQQAIANLFSRVVKERTVELKAIQDKVKNDYDHNGLDLKKANEQYPRLLPLVAEIVTLTELLYRYNSTLPAGYIISPQLTEFFLWHDDGENIDDKINPMIHFDYWKLTSGTFNYGPNSISLNHASLFNITFATALDSEEDFDEIKKALKTTEIAYNIRFANDPVFGDLKDWNDEELNRMNFENQQKFRQQLAMERAALLKELELLNRPAAAANADVTNTAFQDLQIENARLKKEVEILRGYLYHELSRLFTDKNKSEQAIKHYSSELAKQIDALQTEIAGLKEQLVLLKQQEKQSESALGKHKDEEKADGFTGQVKSRRLNPRQR